MQRKREIKQPVPVAKNSVQGWGGSLVHLQQQVFQFFKLLPKQMSLLLERLQKERERNQSLPFKDKV